MTQPNARQPHDIDLHSEYLRADLFLAMGQPIEAAKVLEGVLEAEPDNQSYLDSLGWVSYKRGNYELARGYLDPLVAIKEPVSLGLFAGARDFSKLHPLLRWVLKYVMRLAEGDWRDWDQIRAWAADLPMRFAAEARAIPARGSS